MVEEKRKFGTAITFTFTAVMAQIDMAMDNIGNGMSQLDCRDCGTVVDHPVGRDGDITLCGGCMLNHFNEVDLI